MAPARSLVVEGMLILLPVVIAIQLVEGRWGNEDDTLANMAEYGWHCYADDDDTTPDKDLGLLIDRSPCLKVISPVDGYAFIPPGEDHYRFEIDVAPRGNVNTPAPIEIEWFRVQRDNRGSHEASDMRPMQECKNRLVCDARIHQSDQHQILFPFHVAVSYRGRDETASDDIFLEISSREQDFAANLASVSNTAPAPFTPRTHLNRKDLTGSHDQVARTPRRHAGESDAFTDDLYGEGMLVSDETYDQYNNHLGSESGPERTSDYDPDYGELGSVGFKNHFPLRGKTARGRSMANLEPGSDNHFDNDIVHNQLSTGKFPLPHHRRKAGGYDAANIPVAGRRHLNPLQTRINDDVSDDHDSAEDHGTLKLLDTLESISNRLNQVMATPETVVHDQDLQELSKGLDNMRSNVTKILDILSNKNTQTIDRDDSETIADTVTPQNRDPKKPNSMAGGGSSNETSSGEVGNSTLLSHLGEMAHDLLHQSCSHLAKSYRHFNELSKPQKMSLEQSLEAVDKKSSTGKRKNIEDEFEVSPGSSKTFDSNLSKSRPVVKGRQRRLAGFPEGQEVAGDFLRVWNAVGLTDNENKQRYRENKSKGKGSLPQQHSTEVFSNGKGKHTATNHGRDDFESSAQLDQKGNPQTADSFTTQSPEPEDIRDDFVPTRPTPVLENEPRNPLESNINSKNELKSKAGENAGIRTEVMMIVTPEPGVFLRKDLVLIQPTPTSDESPQAPPPPRSNLSDGSGRDDVQTEIITIITPEPGVLARQDLVVIHPSPKPLDTETVSVDFKSYENDLQSPSPFEEDYAEFITEEVNVGAADSLLLGSTDDTNRSELERTVTGSDSRVNLVDSFESPVLYLEPFPQPEKPVTFQTVLMPTEPAKMPGSDETHSPDLEAQNKIAQYSHEVDQFGPDQSETFVQPSSAARDTQPQFGLDYYVESPAELYLNADSVTEEDTEVFPFDFQTDQPTRGEMDSYQSLFNFDAQTPQPNVEFETEYDDTDVFDLNVDAGTTSEAPVIESKSVDQPQNNEDFNRITHPELAADFVSPFKNYFIDQLPTTSSSESYIDQIYHRLDLNPSLTPSVETIPEGSESELDNNESIEIYDNPFPNLGHTPDLSTSTVAGNRGRQADENKAHIEVHVLQEQPDSHLVDSPMQAFQQTTYHKLVNVSITGEIDEANVKFLSQIFEILQDEKTVEKLTNRWPFLAESRGNNLVIINQEDRGIHIGDRDLESYSRQRNVSSSGGQRHQGQERFGLFGKLSRSRRYLGKAFKRRPGKSEINALIEDENGHRVNVHRKAAGESSSDKIGKIQRKFHEDAISRNDAEGFDKNAKEMGLSLRSSENAIADNEDYQGDGDTSHATMTRSKATGSRTRRNSRDIDDKRRIGGSRGGHIAILSAQREGLKPNAALTIAKTKPKKTAASRRKRLRTRREDSVYRAPSAWSAWSLWSPCSVSCGKGVIIRQRSCTVLELERRRELCTGSSEERAECVVDACLEEEKGQEVEQEEGHSTEMECRYDTTQTPKEIYWMSPTGEKISKDSTAFSEKFKITGSTLIVRGVQSGDIGTYHCVVIMKDGSSETADAKLNVVTCKTNPCHNGGVCVEHDRGNGVMFRCDCTVGFEGHTCQQVSALFMGDVSMAVIALCVLVIVILAVVVFLMKRKQKKPGQPSSGAPASAVVEMDALSPDKPLLTDAEIDLFREISREEFKNFKNSHSYSLFKGRKVSTSGPTIDIEEIDRTDAEADGKSRGKIHKKASVTDTNERQAAQNFASIDDTPTKKSLSAESVSLPSSPAPAIEKVEQQRSAHIAFSSQGQSSLEEILSMADYQESKPRPGSMSSVLSSPVPVPPPTMQQRSSVVESSKSWSSSSVSSRSSTSRAKRSLFYAAQPEYRTSRHVVTYEEEREGIDNDALPRHSHESHMKMDTAQLLARTGSASFSDHTAPLIVKSPSGKLRAVRYEGHSGKTPSLVGLSAPLDSPTRRSSSVFSTESLKAGRGKTAGESQAWIPIEESTTSAMMESPPTSARLTRYSASQRLSADSVGSRRRSIINQEKATSSTASVKTYSHHPSSDANPFSISGTVEGMSVDSLGPRRQSEFHREAQMISSKESVERAAKHLVSESRHSDAVITSSKLPLVEKERLENAISTVYSDTVIKSQYPKSESHSGMTIVKEALSGSCGSPASSVCTAPLIVKSSSGNLRAVKPETHHQHRSESSQGLLITSDSFSKRKASIPSTHSVRNESIDRAFSNESDSGVFRPTSGPTAGEIDEERIQTTQAIRPSKFGFPAYTRRFSLTAESSPLTDEKPKQLSPLLSRDASRASSVVRRASSLATCRSVASRHSSQSAVLTAHEITRVLSDKTPSFNTVEQSTPPIQFQSEEILSKSVSETNREPMEVAASSYHTAVGAFDNNDEVLQEKSPSPDPKSPSHIEMDGAKGTADVTMGTSHHWQPLPEFDDTEKGINTITSPNHHQMNPEGQVLAATPPTDASTVDVTVDEEDHTTDWRPLPEHSSTTRVQDVNIISRDTENDDNQEDLDSSESINGESVKMVHSNHSQEAVSKQRRASKFGYSGYVERFSHIVDSPTAPPSGQTSPSQELRPRQSLEEGDEDEADLPFDDAREGISDQEDSDDNSE